MAKYDYWCGWCEEYEEVEQPMSEAASSHECQVCGGEMKRVFSLPQISAPVYMATDVMNQYAAGEGDPVPSLSRAETMMYANQLAKMQKKNKGQKAYSGPTISTASSPVATPYLKG